MNSNGVGQMLRWPFGSCSKSLFVHSSNLFNFQITSLQIHMQLLHIDNNM
jgi:hypothetical protein